MIIERIYSPVCEMSNAMNAVADKRCTQKDVAGFYADLIRCANIHGVASIDWKKINEAIVTRWPKGLVRIKTMAWKEPQ